MIITRFQFNLRALLVVMLSFACFFGGICFERERRGREDLAQELAAQAENVDRLMLHVNALMAYERQSGG